MDKDYILSKLKKLDISHSRDGDGGYLLVGSIREWIHNLSNQNQVLFFDILVNLASNERSNMWGVALEVLVQEKAISSFNCLIPYLSKKKSNEWKDNIYMGIVRLHYKCYIDKCFTYIINSLEHNRLSILTLLAGTCSIDKERFLEITSNYLARYLEDKSIVSKIKSYIPAFIHNAFEYDEQIIIKLVHKTSIIKVESGNKLADMFKEYLSQSFIFEELGKEKVNRVMATI